MRPPLTGALAAALLLSALAPLPLRAGEAEAAEPDAPRYSATLETWAYASHTALRADSLLNPGNRIARLPGGQALVDVRLHLRAESGPLELVAEPRLVGERDWPGAGSDAAARAAFPRDASALSLTQAFARLKLARDTLLVGRERLSWGPATFRSPSNPFYFDAGKTNPLAAPPGIDLVRYTHAIGSVRVTGVHVASTRELSPAVDLAPTTLLKIDQQGSDHLLSLNVARQPGQPGFVGGFAQFTPDDAWLVYAEFGASRRPAPSGDTALLGASYTLEGGQVLGAEVLRHRGGFTRAGQASYFDQAALGQELARTRPAAGDGLVAQTLGQALRLMGRDYLWLGLSSNAQDSQRYWRVEWTQNLSDRSAQLMGYVERTLAPRLSGFAVLTGTFGDARTEFGALVRARATVGLKWFVF